MRETPRRSLARLALLAPALVAMGACTPQLALPNRPGACEQSGLVLCDATGLCVQPPSAGEAADAGVPTSGSCPAGFSVRQGDTVFLPVPVSRLENVTKAETASDLVVQPARQQTDGSIVVPVFAPHGLPSGDGDFGPRRRLVTIEMLVDGEPVVRHVLVVVSHITASPSGDMSNAGTSASPFATFKQALGVAAAGDTIELVGFNAIAADQPSTPTPCSAPADESVTHVPGGVAVVGRDTLPTALAMSVGLDGDATLENVELSGARLVIQKPGSKVALQNVKLHCGVTVDISASVDPSSDAPGTELTITGSASQIWNDVKLVAPIEVDAIGASVTIEDNASVLSTTSATTPTQTSEVEMISMKSVAQKLWILSHAKVANSTGNASVQLFKPANTSLKPTTVYIEDAELMGPLVVSDPGSSVQINRSHFTVSAFVDASGPAVAAIQFQGDDMKVTASTFDGDGIVQDNPSSAVTVDGMAARNFHNFAYKLSKGKATIVNSDFSHFGGPVVSSTGPWALFVDAPADGLSTISSGTTKYDVATPLAPCEVPGPGDLPGVYSITNKVTIDFH